MTAATIDLGTIAPAATPEVHTSRGVFHDAWVIARRGLTHMKRQPEQLSDATINPIMFVLLFAYVFGGAIPIPGGNYREYLMGGIFAQTIVFTCFGVALALTNDRKNNAVDRFRSLPIAKGAVLGGHAIANMIKSLLPLVIMSLCGLLVGWRIRSGVVDAAGGYLLLIAFAFAMIWVGVLFGSLVKTPEGVTGIAFAVLFPLTFAASTFVPLTRVNESGEYEDTMPGVLQTVAEWNPVTTLANAVRIQFGNPVADQGPASRGRSSTRRCTRCSGRSPSSPSAPRSPCAPTTARSRSSRSVGGMGHPRFHLAVPVDDLDAARRFYGGVLQCPQGREADTWVDWDLYGHQLVTHLAGGAGDSAANPVDGHDVPVPHFGVLLDVESFHELAERVRAAGVDVRDRAVPPFRGAAGRAVDDVLPRSGRQRPRVQGLRRRRRRLRPLTPFWGRSVPIRLLGKIRVRP